MINEIQTCTVHLPQRLRGKYLKDCLDIFFVLFEDQSCCLKSNVVRSEPIREDSRVVWLFDDRCWRIFCIPAGGILCDVVDGVGGGASGRFR